MLFFRYTNILYKSSISRKRYNFRESQQTTDSFWFVGVCEKTENKQK